jgi:hypothetical protein
MNIEQAKAIPISEILNRVGLKPARSYNQESWFLSPLRAEKTASFHVHNEKNLWFDFGEAIGGDTVRLAQAILQSQGQANSVSDALKWLDQLIGSNVVFVKFEKQSEIKKQPVYSLDYVSPITRPQLIHYLHRRGIPLSLGQHYLKQACVLNTNTGRLITALAWDTENGGLELTKPGFKASVGAKTISFIRGQKSKPPGIHVFEGMMDYLSAITQLEGRPFQDDTIILNSVSNMTQILPYLYQYGYSVGYTWMDNDEAGRKAQNALTHIFKQEHSLMVHTPMNEVYRPFKDVNAWHMQKLGL